jgi:DHA1 family inner membrane transport protein
VAARVPGGSLVSAANQAAFNVANALGAALGALVLSLGWGYAAPMWVGAVLASAGAGISVVAGRADRRETTRVTTDVRLWQEARDTAATVVGAGAHTPAVPGRSRA